MSNTSLIQVGQVKFFAPYKGEDKKGRYGFIYLCDFEGNRFENDDTQLYFNSRGARRVIGGGINGVKLGSEKLALEDVPKLKSGALIVYTTIEGKRGLEVDTWAPLSEWKQIIDQVVETPLTMLVRFTTVNCRAFRTILWSGTDLLELSVMHPKYKTLQGDEDSVIDDFGDDPDFHRMHRFYEEISDGKFKPTSDPRTFWDDIPDADIQALTPDFDLPLS